MTENQKGYFFKEVFHTLEMKSIAFVLIVLCISIKGMSSLNAEHLIEVLPLSENNECKRQC